MKNLILLASLTIFLPAMLMAECNKDEGDVIKLNYGGVTASPRLLETHKIDFWTVNTCSMEALTNGVREWYAYQGYKDSVDWSVTGATWVENGRGGAIIVTYNPPSWILDVIGKVDMGGFIPNPYRNYRHESHGEYGKSYRLYSRSAALAKLLISIPTGIWGAICFLAEYLF